MTGSGVAEAVCFAGDRLAVLAAGVPARRALALAGALPFVLAGCAKRTPPPPPFPGYQVPGAAAPNRDAERTLRGRGATTAPDAGRDTPTPSADAPPFVPTGDLAADPILNSPWAGHEGIQEGIEWWLNYWRVRGEGSFRRSLIRMGRYEEFIADELSARGLPPSLRFLPVIEAAYNPTALSPVGAAGLWQFMPATARWLGLEVGSLVDERFDPYAATPRAVEYLARLHKQFGSWFLALAAYNSGPGRVERIIREHASGRPRNDALFWTIRSKLPPETRNFIPKYLAAVRMGENPASFGLGDFARDPRQTFDLVAVEGAASLDVVAAVAGVKEDTVRFLNPQLVRGLTPAGHSTEVRLPLGRGRGFAERFAAVPASDRVTFQEHAVASGETLYGIARNYRVSLDDLTAANPDVSPRRLRIGTVLVIPRAGAASAGTPAAGAANAPPGVHVVRQGESLWLIARRYEIDVESLRAHNDLAEDAVLHPGDELRIPRGPRGRR